MDASIMDGSNRNAGAVTGVTATRNPISLARAVMEHSPHVFLSREGADQFSREQGLPQEPPEYFQTPSAAASSRSCASRPERRAFRRPPQIWHGRRGRARPGGPCRRRDLDRRPDRQALGPDRRFADHRRRHLCRRPRLRGLGDRRRRIFHPGRRRPRNLRADPQALPATRSTRRRRSGPTDAEGNPTYMVHASEMALEPGRRAGDRRRRDRRGRRARRLGRGDRRHALGRRRLQLQHARACIAARPRPPAARSRSTATRRAAAMIRAHAPSLWLVLLLPCSPAPASAWWEYGHETVGADRLAERQPAHPRRDRPAARAGAAARHADLPGPDDRAGQLLARLHQDARRAVQLRLALALSECRYLPAVRPASGLPRRQLRLGADRAQRPAARRPRSVPTRERLMALAFLVHFMGDLHQPMHAGDHGDLGGNRVQVSYGVIAGRTNLHFGLGRLSRRPRHLAAARRAGRHPLRAERGRQSGDARRAAIADWARESWEASREFAYGTIMADPCGPGAGRAAGDHRGDHPAADPDDPPPGGARRAPAGAAARRGVRAGFGLRPGAALTSRRGGGPRVVEGPAALSPSTSSRVPLPGSGEELLIPAPPSRRGGSGPRRLRWRPDLAGAPCPS